MRKSLNISTYVASIDTYVDMLSDLRILVFGTFVELAMHIETSRSRRLFYGFQCFLVQNEGVVLLVSFLDSTVAVFHWRWTKTSDEVKKYDFTKHFSQSLGYTENEIHSDYVGKNTEILKIIISITGGSLNTTSPTTPPSMVIIGPIEKLAGPYNHHTRCSECLPWVVIRHEPFPD